MIGVANETVTVTPPVNRPGRNPLGEAAFAVALLGFALNIWAGLLLLGWLVAPIGAILGIQASVRPRNCSRVFAVGALIVTVASIFAEIAMYRDVVAPYMST